MNNLSYKVFFISLLLSVSAVLSSQVAPKNAEKRLFGKSHSSGREAKATDPKKVTSAKKDQEAKKRKQDKEYKKSVKKSRKRAYEIQSPEVKERMKQNKKNTVIRDKEKKKKAKANTKKASKKYN